MAINIISVVPALLAICSYCCFFIVFVCLSLWCWGVGGGGVEGLNVDLNYKSPSSSYLLYI